MRPLAVRWLGRLAYPEALALQDLQVAARRAGDAPDTLLLLEHPPVVTLGRSAHAENLLQSREALEARGVALRRPDECERRLRILDDDAWRDGVISLWGHVPGR